jgi:hypothetical protein
MKVFIAVCLGLLTVAKAHASPHELQVANANIQVDIDEDATRRRTNSILQWITRSARIVAHYYDRFPTNHLRIRVVDVADDGVRNGRTWGRDGGFIRIQVGKQVTDDQLSNDWVLVHEMTHLALPDVGDDHSWLSEGMAVYIEGVARVQAGNRSESDVWSEELRSMPRGLPQGGDLGLDHTHTWGRTYWGGAMFCLLADVEIHERTHNRFGLQDAARAIAKESGGLSADWPIERIIKTGDDAVGVPVLAELYAQMKDKPVKPDLLTLWRKLGVEPDSSLGGPSVRLTDDAPLAPVRHSIMKTGGSFIPAQEHKK